MRSLPKQPACHETRGLSRSAGAGYQSTGYSTPVDGSCYNTCGGWSGSCSCAANCTSYGNCCADACAYCGQCTQTEIEND